MPEETLGSTTNKSTACPVGVKIVAWIMVAVAGIGAIMAMVMLGTLSGKGEVPPYIVANVNGRAVHPSLAVAYAFAAGSGVFAAAFFADAMYMLKGRLWAYYVAAALWGLSALNAVWRFFADLTGTPTVLRIDISWAPFVLLVLAWSQYERFAVSSRADGLKRSSEP